MEIENHVFGDENSLRHLGPMTEFIADPMDVFSWHSLM